MTLALKLVSLKSQTAVALPSESKSTLGSKAKALVGEATIGVDQTLDPMGRYADSIKITLFPGSDWGQTAKALPDRSTATLAPNTAKEPRIDPGVDMSTAADQTPPTNLEASVTKDEPIFVFQTAAATPDGFTDSCGPSE